MNCSRRSFLASAAALAAGAGPDTPHSRARKAWDALILNYWDGERLRFRLVPGGAEPVHFWIAAQLLQCVMDASLLFRDARLRRQIGELCGSFFRLHPDWKTNAFNDDIMWWIGALCRAAKITGDARYLARAQKEYSRLAATEIDDALGGGFWWKSDAHGSKNACVNGPAAIAACELAAALRNSKYLDEARKLYAWERKTLFDPQTGRVFDAIGKDGRLHRALYTYNAGTFIGAALRLSRQTREPQFPADARLAADCLMRELSPGGILKSEGQGDGGAFKLIAARHLAELAALPGFSGVAAFLKANALRAWENRRRSDCVMGFDWSRAVAPGERIECQSAASGVAALLSVAALQ